MNKKAWSRLLLAPRFKGSRIAPVCRNEQPRKPHADYMPISPRSLPPYRYKTTRHTRVCSQTYLERLRCFVFDKLFELARFLNRQNKSASKRLLSTKTPLDCRDTYNASCVKGHCKNKTFISIQAHIKANISLPVNIN